MDIRKTNDCDLIVIGGGILGTFHAYHALERGKSVLLLERDEAPRQATVRNFGQVVPSGMNLKWQRYGRESLEIYAKLQGKTDISARRNGSIYLASDEEECVLIEELHAINRANDYESHLLTAAQCRERYPALRPDYCRAGLFFPQEFSVNPRLMIHRVRALLQQNPKFTYKGNCTAVHIEQDYLGCDVLDSSGNAYRAEKVLVCSGSDFKTLYPQLFQASDLQLVKLQMLRTLPQTAVRLPGNLLTGLSVRRYESFSECPSYARIKAGEAPDSFHKQWGIHILFKQEENGSVILGDSHEYADAARTEDLPFDLRSDINEYFMQEALKIINLDNTKIDVQWAGFYSQCKENDIYQRQIGERVHILTGIGGKGMTASPGFAAEHIKHLL